MRSRLSTLIVFFAAVQILGGHWMALQSVAWIGMLASYSRGETLVEAIEKTFDGAHPCGLCEVVKTGRTEEQKQPAAKVLVKLDAVLALLAAMPAPDAAAWVYPEWAATASVRNSSPPTPPPLAA